MDRLDVNDTLTVKDVTMVVCNSGKVIGENNV